MNWRTTKREFEWITKIADRAFHMADRQGASYPYRDALMDITAVHANGCPLRLEELYKAAPFDFSHDIGGILRHLDRTTGKLKDCFKPRYAQNSVVPTWYRETKGQPDAQ